METCRLGSRNTDVPVYMLLGLERESHHGVWGVLFFQRSELKPEHEGYGFFGHGQNLEELRDLARSGS